MFGCCVWTQEIIDIVVDGGLHGLLVRVRVDGVVLLRHGVVVALAASVVVCLIYNFPLGVHALGLVSAVDLRVRSRPRSLIPCLCVHHGGGMHHRGGRSQLRLRDVPLVLRQPPLVIKLLLDVHLSVGDLFLGLLLDVEEVVENARHCLRLDFVELRLQVPRD